MNVCMYMYIMYSEKMLHVCENTYFGNDAKADIKLLLLCATVFY